MAPTRGGSIDSTDFIKENGSDSDNDNAISFDPGAPGNSTSNALPCVSLRQLMNMRRGNYNSVVKYVKKLEKAYKLAKGLGVGITPYAATLMLLREASTDLPQ
ncbi:hypothetical protein BO78DRAFT_416567 [Aspergillus sclerotiicarbonarius CBS 121057]|uniref:Uncharacterized protein n=1 Tax=Aspergillus sclerotiicarbonarius (strain CBS 121057 / IBT 28362) TaxID=1448318 RepID=A0A319EEM1_ASPSB|nr:hypothetical protein BO78DRAFT_416567 [Aspergillus sclerotiicarbonarius CBS 121057]